MDLINSFKTELKDFWRFLQIDIKDIPYQFNVLFPKVPKHTEEERREMGKEVVSYVGGYCDGNYSFYKGRYITDKDIKNKRKQLGI